MTILHIGCVVHRRRQRQARTLTEVGCRCSPKSCAPQPGKGRTAGLPIVSTDPSALHGSSCRQFPMCYSARYSLLAFGMSVPLSCGYRRRAAGESRTGRVGAARRSGAEKEPAASRRRPPQRSCDGGAAIYSGGRELRRRSCVGVVLGRAGAEEFAEVGDCEGDGAAFGGEDQAFFDQAVSGWGEGLGFAVEGGGDLGGGD
jgi:hypothetical protein